MDFRIYHKEEDAKTKNDHFADMLKEAKDRQFNPDCVLFDGWYASVEQPETHLQTWVVFPDTSQEKS